MKISVIIPVYNTEDYLVDCVRSLQAQKHEDWEAILVDDGSRDGSGLLCDRLAKEEPRLKVIHQANGGVSRARNQGVALAEGEQICFLDSDDLLSPDYLSWFAEKKESSGADYICCGHAEKRGETVTAFDLPAPQPLLPADDFVSLALADKLKLPLVCWSWLFPAEKLKERRFREGVSFGEDTLFVLTLLSEGGTVYYEPAPHYIYRMDREGNTLTNTTLEKAEKTVAIWQVMAQIYPEGSAPCALIQKILLGYSAAAQRKAARDGTAEQRRKYRRISAGCWKKLIPARVISLKDKIRLLFYWTFPLFSEKVMLKLYGRV